MNIRHFLLVFLVLFFCASSDAQEVVVQKYLFAGPHSLRMPFQVDSTNVKQQPFSVQKMLQSPVWISPESPGVSIKEAAEGKLLVENTQDGYAVYAISFYIHPDRYTKTVLNVSGVKHAEIYLDDKVQKKNVKGDVDLSLESRRYLVTMNGLLEKQQADTLQISLKSKDNALIALSVGQEKSYDIYDVLEGKRIQSASLSPNGKWINIRYTITLPDGKVESYAEVISKDTDEVLYTTPQSINWMPYSNLLYYTKTGSQGRELLTIDPETHQEEVLAVNLPDGWFSFSPTEDYLIFTVQEKGDAEPADLRRILNPEDRQPGWRNRVFLHAYDLQTGLFQRLTFGYRSTYLQDISADGRYVLISSRVSDLTVRPFSTTDLFQMDLQTGKVDTIFSEEPFIGSIRFSPDATQLLVSGSGEAFGGIGQDIAEGQTSNMSDTQLFLYDPNTQHGQPLTKAFNPSVGRFVWNAFDKQIYFSATDKDCVHLYTINPDTKKIKSIPTQEDVLSGFSLPTQAAGMVYYGQGASNSDRLHIYDAKKKKSSCRVDVSAEVLKGVRLGKVEDWSFIAEAGDTIHGRFYLPADFDPQKKYPLIVNYYGGTTPVSRVLESRYPHHAYAAQGYIVYVIQPSGAIGFGQDFSARHVNAWGIRTSDEIIEGTQKFCQEHSFVDASKIGCIGASYGGFMTMLLQTKTDIFAAAISHAGISDITSYWGEGYWGYSYNALAAANSYPWDARHIYVEQSPLFHADKVNTPILFLHGSVDTNVPVGESIQMFTALKLLGKTTEFVQVEGQDHHILDYSKRIRWTNTIFAWFDKWLKEQPEWWEAQYPPKKL